MGVQCEQNCSHRIKADTGGLQIESNWKWAFDTYGFTVPVVQIRSFRCGNDSCDGRKRKNWRKLNPSIDPEFKKCLFCENPLIQVIKTEEPLQEIQQHSISKVEQCPLCSSDDFKDDQQEGFEICNVCGYIREDSSYESGVLVLNSGVNETATQKQNKYDLMSVNRIISGGDRGCLNALKQLIGISIEAWPKIAQETMGRGVSNLPPRYCECRKAVQSQGRSRMILHLHQILQEKGNVKSISDMLQTVDIHPRYFRHFINSGPVGNHLPNLKLSDGRHHLPQVAELLIDSVDSLEINDLLLDEIMKEFDALEDSNQFIISSNLENGLWSFRNNEPCAHKNGYILMMIPYAIAITRAIRSIHGRRFGAFIRHLGEMAIADARFTGGGDLQLENGWN